MKHTVKITLILLFIFLAAQIVGLATVSKYIDVSYDESGEIEIIHGDTAIGPQPEIKEKSYSFVMIIIMVMIGTGLLFLLIKFRLGNLWRYGFFFAVLLAVTVALGVYVNKYIAMIIALILAYLKVFRPNLLTHNLTEIFIYAGITIIILPFLNIYSAFMLLLVISVYDMYAVWKSKHMIKLAKFQTKSKAFAGLAITYKEEKTGKIKAKKETKKKKIHAEPKTAILGGGDVAFPLLFSAVIMEHMIINGMGKITALYSVMVIPIIVTIVLGGLLFIAQKDRYYPAMPFVSAGCVLGYLVLLVV